MIFVEKTSYYVCPKTGEHFRLYTTQCIDCEHFISYLHETISCNYHILSQTTKIEEPIKYNYSVSCPHCSEKIFYLLKHYKKVNAVELEWVMKKTPSGCEGCQDFNGKECIADPLPEDVNTCFKAKEALYK